MTKKKSSKVKPPSLDEESFLTTDYYTEATNSFKHTRQYGSEANKIMAARMDTTNNVLWQLLRFETGAAKLANSARPKNKIEKLLVSNRDIITSLSLWPSIPPGSGYFADILSEYLNTIISISWCILRLLHKIRGAGGREREFETHKEVADITAVQEFWPQFLPHPSIAEKKLYEFAESTVKLLWSKYRVKKGLISAITGKTSKAVARKARNKAARDVTPATDSEPKPKPPSRPKKRARKRKVAGYSETETETEIEKESDNNSDSDSGSETGSNSGTDTDSDNDPTSNPPPRRTTRSQAKKEIGNVSPETEVTPQINFPSRPTTRTRISTTRGSRLPSNPPTNPQSVNTPVKRKQDHDGETTDNISKRARKPLAQKSTNAGRSKANTTTDKLLRLRQGQQQKGNPEDK